jgi:hypothetical protein
MSFKGRTTTGNPDVFVSDFAESSRKGSLQDPNNAKAGVVGKSMKARGPWHPPARMDPRRVPSQLFSIHAAASAGS